MKTAEKLIHEEMPKCSFHLERKIRNLRARIKTFEDMLKHDMPTCRLFLHHTSTGKLTRLLLESKTDSLQHISPIRKREWARLIERELALRN